MVSFVMPKLDAFYLFFNLVVGVFNLREHGGVKLRNELLLEAELQPVELIVKLRELPIEHLNVAGCAPGCFPRDRSGDD